MPKSFAFIAFLLMSGLVVQAQTNTNLVVETNATALVEVTNYIPGVVLDIRYATSNNLCFTRRRAVFCGAKPPRNSRPCRRNSSRKGWG